MKIAIDFDGTCVTHEFPKVGKDIGAQRVLKRLIDSGHQLILFTMRSDIFLEDAERWFDQNNIPIWGVNTNPEQSTWTTSPKAYAQLYIDDAALGCPLRHDLELSVRPFVHWDAVEEILEADGVLPNSSL